MKKPIIYLILFLAFFSCKEDFEENNASLSELKGQKQSVIKKIDSLNTLLKRIENNIARLEPTTNYPVISVLEPKVEDFKHFIEIQGVVKADRNIEIRPEIGGTIMSIRVREGQRVHQGQVLMQLDDSSIQDNIAELETQLFLAKTTYERQQRLWKQKIGSEMQYLQAKTQYESLQKNKAALENQASKMKIKAPFSGIIDEIFPKKGELASPQAPVIRLVNLDNLYIEADVTETYLPYIKVGSEALISFSSIGLKMKSKIAQVGNVINPNNRSFKTKIFIKNDNNMIKPNLLADIKITDFTARGITIPSSIIQTDRQGKSFVYVIVKKDDQYITEKRNITVKKEYDHISLVSDGINESDLIVNNGARSVKNGEIVKLAD